MQNIWVDSCINVLNSTFKSGTVCHARVLILDGGSEHNADVLDGRSEHDADVLGGRSEHDAHVLDDRSEHDAHVLGGSQNFASLPHCKVVGRPAGLYPDPDPTFKNNRS